MPRIVAAAHALPPNRPAQAEIRDLIGRLYAGRIDGLQSLLRVFDNARIAHRSLMRSLPWYLERPGSLERTRIYQEEGFELLRRACCRCLKGAGVEPGQIDHLIFVSSTGHATPTLDARLINELAMGPATSRLPIWGLGCAGGAAGLSRAYDYCLAHPGARVLVATLECCSLTFIEQDLTRKNVVGTALFSDGAAAALLCGAETGASGPRLRAVRSHLYPDSYRIMGWDFLEQGMQLVLSPRLPAVVRGGIGELVRGFLDDAGLSIDDLAHYLTHPGGAKVLEAYRDALGLGGHELALSEAVLRDHGNLSSATLLLVLERWLDSEAAKQPGHGLLSAFGPGFSAELGLLEVV